MALDLDLFEEPRITGAGPIGTNLDLISQLRNALGLPRPTRSPTGRAINRAITSPESSPGLQLGENLLTAKRETDRETLNTAMQRSGLAGSPSGPGVRALTTLNRQGDIDLGNLALQTQDRALAQGLGLEQLSSSSFLNELGQGIGIYEKAEDRKVQREAIEALLKNALASAGGTITAAALPRLLESIFGPGAEAKALQEILKKLGGPTLPTPGSPTLPGTPTTGGTPGTSPSSLPFESEQDLFGDLSGGVPGPGSLEAIRNLLNQGGPTGFSPFGTEQELIDAGIIPDVIRNFGDLGGLGELAGGFEALPEWANLIGGGGELLGEAGLSAAGGALAGGEGAAEGASWLSGLGSLGGFGALAGAGGLFGLANMLFGGERRSVTSPKRRQESSNKAIELTTKEGFTVSPQERQLIVAAGQGEAGIQSFNQAIPSLSTGALVARVLNILAHGGLTETGLTNDPAQAELARRGIGMDAIQNFWRQYGTVFPDQRESTPFELENVLEG